MLDDRTQTVPKGRRIAMLRATPETQHALREWAMAQGFDLAWNFDGWPQTTWDFGFHVTLLATENAVAIPEGARWVEPVTVEVSGFEVLGIDDRVPVLRLADHPALTAMREFFITTFGAKPTFPDFKPHVSLSYKWTGEPDLASLSPPPFPLVFDFLVVGQFDTKPKVKDGAMSDFATALMLDKAEISGTRITRDGYMVADVRAARSGIQQYAGHEVGKPDMAVVNVYRPEGEVFNKDSLASYAFKPVTINHPSTGVTADNWKQLSVGNVGGEVARDGGFVRVPLVLMDAQAIDAVKNGLREISMGYDVRLEFVDGVTPDGEAYQAIQRDIRINHAALVERGRAGSACRIGDRGAPASEVPRQPVSNQGNDSMTRKIVVDGLTIETTDAGAEAIAKRDAQLADQSKALADAAAALEKANGTIKSLQADHEKTVADLTSKIPTADQMEAMLDKRAALIDTAKTLAPKLADSFKGKSAADVRKAVVASRLGDDAVKGKDEAFISAQFDTLALIGGNGGATDQVRDAIRGGLVSNVNDADKARAETLQKQRDAWAN